MIVANSGAMMTRTIAKLLVFAWAFSYVLLPTPPVFAQGAELSDSDVWQQARTAFSEDRLDDAIDSYQQLLVRDTENVQAMIELANVYERSGRLEYARGLLIRAVKVAPGNDQISARLEQVNRMLLISLEDEVLHMMEAKDFEGALPKLSLLSTLDESNPEYHFQRAVCYESLRKYTAGVKAIDEAIVIENSEQFTEVRNRLRSAAAAQRQQDRISKIQRLANSTDASDRAEAEQLLQETLGKTPDDEWAAAELKRLQTMRADTAATDTTNAGWAGTSIGWVKAAPQNVGAFFSSWWWLFALLGVVALVFRSPLAKALARKFAPVPTLSGQLEHFGLREIMLLLNAEPHTGVLHVRAKGCTGRIYFDEGEACHAQVGKLAGQDAVERLVDAAESGTFEFIDGPMSIQQTIDTPLSMMLMEHAAASQPSTDGRPKSQFRELLDSSTR